jgi:hypothetical protein
MKVTFYKSIKDVSPYQNKDVGFYLDRIKNGKSEQLCKDLRFSTDKEERKAIKLQLPVVTFGGDFSKRNNASLRKASGLLTLDFDDVQDIPALITELKANKSIFSCWTSPSGNGVKALVKIPIVQDDKEYKEYFKQISAVFTGVDESGKDIARACFESYDPDIYVNLDADNFIIDYDALPVESNDVGTITNLPIIDHDEVANRLMTWFKKKYNSQNRNSSLYKLAAAFNNFGINKITCQSYLLPFEQKDFTKNEILALINSAYKKTSNFGTKHFEDKEKKDKLINFVLSGKSDAVILEEFNEYKKENIESEIQTIKEVIKVDEFWKYDFKGDVLIIPYRFKLFLENLQYYKYYPVANTKTFVFITKNENFINHVSEFQIKDRVMDYLVQSNRIPVFDAVAEKSKLFTPQYLSMIDTANVEMERDGIDYGMIYYKNAAVKVFDTYHEIYEYSELKGYVWNNQIIDRDFIDADHHESMFRSFVWFISGQETERYNTMKSVIGYMLHSYKTSANNKAIILNDETISDNPNGGSGKGILINAIGYMKKVSTIDGKTFDFNKSFPYQTVSTDCQVLAFDDVRKNFDFERLFSLITEGLTIEYKGRDAIKLPVKDSPKVLISTNYTIKADGGSFKRRMFEVELSSYFGTHHTPFDEFGSMLFEDWNEQEWARFDHYMINCLNYYLKNGLVESEAKNLELRKFINETSQDFIEWVNAKNLGFDQRLNKVSMFENFIAEYTDQKKHLTNRTFNKWCKKYAEYNGKEYVDGSSNGARWFEIKSQRDPDIWDTVNYN